MPIVTEVITIVITLVTKRSNDPGELLFGQTRRGVLGWLFSHADERFFLRQIARETALAPSLVQRELVGLVAAGLVTRDRDGHQVYFQANRASHVFAELQALLSKTVGTVALIRRALATLGSEIDVAWIFGSFAAATIRKGSDIDLMVVGRASFADVVGAVSDPQRILGRDINPVVYTPEEFRKKLASGQHFATSVVQEPKQFVIGDEGGIAGLAKERMASRTQDQRRRNRRTVGGRRTRPRR